MKRLLFLSLSLLFPLLVWGQGFSSSPATTIRATNVLDNAGSIFLYIPNQTDFLGSMTIGSGGRNLSTNGNTLSPGKYNLFIGVDAGKSATTNEYNTFIGYNAGEHAEGGQNTAVGAYAGHNITSGSGNSLFSYDAGQAITTGERNAVFGGDCLPRLTTGNYNSIFGTSTASYMVTNSGCSIFGAWAGQQNLGDNNSFFGFETGIANTTGHHGAFFGDFAGSSNTVENFNTYLGSDTFGLAGVTNSTAIGFEAIPSAANQMMFGNANVTSNVFHGGAYFPGKVGIGIAPSYNFQVNGQMRIEDYIDVHNASSGTARYSIATLTFPGEASISSGATTNKMRFLTGASEQLRLTEGGVNIPTQSTPPSAPSDGFVLIYAVTNGAGKIVVAAKFSDGSTNAFATQP